MDNWSKIFPIYILPPGSKSVLFLFFAAFKLIVQGCPPVEQGVGFSDRLKKPLKVKPEGIPVEKVQSEFKCLDNSVDKVAGIFVLITYPAPLKKLFLRVLKGL